MAAAFFNHLGYPRKRGILLRRLAQLRAAAPGIDDGADELPTASAERVDAVAMRLCTVLSARARGSRTGP